MYANEQTSLRHWGLGTVVVLHLLVLLVIFIVTAPLLTHAVKVDLPRASSTPNLTQPDNIQLANDAASQVYWNGEAVDADTLSARMQLAAAQAPLLLSSQPALLPWPRPMAFDHHSISFG